MHDPVNAISIDVEDYFQVEALSSVFPRDRWEGCELRVERNTDRLLDLFDDAGVKATFFTLGWVARRRPALVRRIAEAGHEIASHGYGHQRVDRLGPQSFRADIAKAKRVLEDASGGQVRGYRAPTFSIGSRTPWAWRILEEEGHAYSSSVYPIRRDLYGAPDAPLTPYRPDGVRAFLEIPISAVRIGGRTWPGGGGGFFRLLPYALSREAISRVNAEGRPAVFYLHPWEIDPRQPRASGAPWKSRFRHYLNLSRTEPRLRRLLRAARWDRMDRVFADHLNQARGEMAA